MFWFRLILIGFVEQVDFYAIRIYSMQCYVVYTFLSVTKKYSVKNNILIKELTKWTNVALYMRIKVCTCMTVIKDSILTFMYRDGGGGDYIVTYVYPSNLWVCNETGDNFKTLIFQGFVDCVTGCVEW